MTTFLALATALAVGWAVYHFAPKEGELPFWPFQESPHDRAFGTYDQQRQYRDLEAIRSRGLDNSEPPVQSPKTGLAPAPQRGRLAA
ncbi:hypothetical protein [Nocardia caishijiensis]|uniref:Uncharacterized protein n=1 Tax=Nocardia caishijiensis TaxID=184756 RepID=A0ABQ6YTN9_9NOCA|nr:hypothetical protein [Nocardia caishijiensis]KAF0849173.1 hypothetical protein FNL39_101610 [Nocardia caishijiensis]